MDLERLKARLRACEVVFNEPHVTERLAVRGGSRKELVKMLKEPERLIHAEERIGSKGDPVHILYFEKDGKTEKIPVIFLGEKSLLVLTYILRHRRWKR